MKTIPVFAAFPSARLTYTLDWLFKDVLNTDYSIVSNEQEAIGLPFVISYGNTFGKKTGFCIHRLFNAVTNLLN